MTHSQLEAKTLAAINLPHVRQLMNRARYEYAFTKHVCRYWHKRGDMRLWSIAMQKAKAAKRTLRASIAWVEIGLYGVESKHK